MKKSKITNFQYHNDALLSKVLLIVNPKLKETLELTPKFAKMLRSKKQSNSKQKLEVG